MAEGRVPSSKGGKMNPDWYKVYYEKNKERILKKNREYWRENGKIHRRNTDKEYRSMTISLLRERDGDNCGVCGMYVSPEQETVDHIIGVRMGGLSTADNIQLTHIKCNLHKLRPKSKK